MCQVNDHNEVSSLNLKISKSEKLLLHIDQKYFIHCILGLPRTLSGVYCSKDILYVAPTGYFACILVKCSCLQASMSKVNFKNRKTTLGCYFELFNFICFTFSKLKACVCDFSTRFAGTTGQLSKNFCPA